MSLLKDDVNAVFLRKYVDHVYIINLEHRKDRREHIRKQMVLLGIPDSQYSFVKATDRSWASQKAGLMELGFREKDLPENGLLTRDVRRIDKFLDRQGLVYSRIRTKNHRNLGLAEMAVTLSHARIWNHIINTGKNTRALILEDDACLSTAFAHSDLKILLTRAGKDFPKRELVLLGYCFPTDTVPLIRSKHNVLETGKYSCTQSYIITPSIASKMINKVFPVSKAVDSLFHDQALMSKALVFKIPVFFQSETEGVKSDIQLEGATERELADTNAMKFGQCIRGE